MLDKKYFYNEFAKDFDRKMNMYDTNVRLGVIFDYLLKDENIKGKRLLDAGSGTGWFSKWACERGAIVTALDVGENLLNEVKKKCNVDTIVGDILDLKFQQNHFDFVVSSEVIEHTVNPLKAVRELVRVVKKGGVIALTTPNIVWYWSIDLANKFHIRPYEGYENWVGYYQLRRWFIENGCIIEKQKGFHMAPLFFSKIFYRPLQYFDKFGTAIGPLMLNIAIKARKS